MVGIKDFEMPHNCDSCPFFMGENTHCTVGCFAPYGYDDYGEKRPKDCPLVEVVPKDQYEARLKADLEAILIDMQLEIEEVSRGIGLEKVVDVIDVDMIIQQKINALKAETEDT